MAEHEQVYQINGECPQCGRMYCDNGEQCALAIALRNERNIADQSEEVAKLRAALAESQRRERVLRGGLNAIASNIADDSDLFLIRVAIRNLLAVTETQPESS